MNDPTTLQRCLTYVEAQLGPHRPTHHGPPPPSVTLSRQSGAGGVAIAQHLAGFLDQHAPAAVGRWTIFDKSLVERVLHEHNLPAKFAQYMPEDRVNYLRDTVEELLGLHPSASELVTRVTHTILGLAELGHCILIGRAAHVILARSPSTFRVRLVCPFEKRVQRIMRSKDLDHTAAMEFARHEDAARARYLHTHFERNIDDPMGYHLILNTDSLTDAQAAAIIGRAVMIHGASNADAAAVAAPGPASVSQVTPPLPVAA